ncbi:NAD(P)/FAD-dependent oxidoreductase [Streptomyces sp. NPDC005775]|uniref:NAD(P)/FAD-dependent oxidoreductase n=1 Tax=Streptomyces sp. NPDC005775 TaxID=3364729 RepID=UPI0036A88EBD
MKDLDIAVVGGGIIGCLTAREAVRRAPGASVAVLEGDAVGSGASRRSAGLHFPRGASERVRRMSAYSERFYGGLRAAEPGLPVHPVGLSVLAKESAGAEIQELYLEGARPRRTDAPPAPLTVLPDGHAAWTCDGAQYAYVGALAQELARGLRPAVSFREGNGVTSLEPKGDGYLLGLGTGERLYAGSVVIAPGPWLAAPAWRSYVAPLGARVKKVVALHVEQAPAPGDGVVVFHEEDAFLLPLHERGHWLFSYTCQEWDVDPDRLSGALTAGELAEARAALASWAPGMAERAVGGRVFCDAYSENREPLVRALDPDGGLVFAGAANGSGYRLGPAIAAEAVDLLSAARGVFRAQGDQGDHA